jgi:hypothetical protein
MDRGEGGPPIYKKVNTHFPKPGKLLRLWLGFWKLDFEVDV